MRDERLEMSIAARDHFLREALAPLQTALGLALGKCDELCIRCNRPCQRTMSGQPGFDGCMSPRYRAVLVTARQDLLI